MKGTNQINLRTNHQMTLHVFVKAMYVVNDQDLLHLYMHQLFATMTKVLDFCKRP